MYAHKWIFTWEGRISTGIYAILRKILLINPYLIHINLEISLGR